MKLIDNAHTALLTKMMDVYSLRNKITSSNIANFETPGYKKQEVNFEETLAETLSANRLSKESVKSMNPSIVSSDKDVDLDQELMELADTQIRVQLTTRTLRHNFEQLRMGITSRTG